ncbi:hypothetical protein JAO29_23325, partial [Edaphobacter sp. HDX4]
DELNRTDFVERSDGAAGYDGEFRRQRGDGDEPEVGPTGEQFVAQSAGSV